MYVLFASNVPLFITTIYDAQVKKFEVFHRNVLCMYVCMHVCAENENLTGRELVAFQNVVSRNSHTKNIFDDKTSYNKVNDTSIKFLNKTNSQSCIKIS